MKRKIDVALSTDPMKDLQSIINYAKLVQPFADLLHCDVMDGEFVKNKTYNYDVVASINKQTLIPLDVHLMVDEPLNKLDDFIDAGANILTVHYEAFEDAAMILDALKYIRKRGVMAGISFRPSTPLKEVKPYFYCADVVLVMSVEPGKSGQALLEETYERISEINKLREENKLNFKIEVDGGVNDKNAPLLIEMGADILVSGSYVYNSKDREKAVRSLRKVKA